jgi:chaperone modulatory protein CbpM
MMMTLAEVVITVGRIEQAELTRWVDLGWVAPSRSASGAEVLFSEVDVARIRMICDLRRDLVVEEETMPLLLSLLDQIYALRHQMTALTAAVRARPEEVRRAILAHLRETSTPQD